MRNCNLLQFVQEGPAVVGDDDAVIRDYEPKEAKLRIEAEQEQITVTRYRGKRTKFLQRAGLSEFGDPIQGILGGSPTVTVQLDGRYDIRNHCWTEVVVRGHPDPLETLYRRPQEHRQPGIQAPVVVKTDAGYSLCWLRVLIQARHR